MNEHRLKPELIAEFSNHRRATAILAAEQGCVWVRTYIQHPAERYTAQEFAWQSESQPVRMTSGLAISGSWATKLAEPRAFHSTYSVEGHLKDSYNQDLAALGAALGEHEQFRRSADIPRSYPLIVRFLQQLPTSLDTIPSSPNVLQAVLCGRETAIRDLVNSWLAPSEPLYEIHGEYSMANVVRGEDAELVVLCDPVQWQGPQGFDAGWFLGDLAELAHSTLSPFTFTHAVRGARAFLDDYLGAIRTPGEVLTGIRVGLLLRLIYHFVEYRVHPLSSGSGEEGLKLLDLELSAGLGSLGKALGLTCGGSLRGD